jgi:hypothetical protein
MVPDEFLILAKKLNGWVEVLTIVVLLFLLNFLTYLNSFPLLQGIKLKYSPTKRGLDSFHIEICTLNRMFNGAELFVLLLVLLYSISMFIHVKKVPLYLPNLIYKN